MESGCKTVFSYYAKSFSLSLDYEDGLHSQDVCYYFFHASNNFIYTSYTYIQPAINSARGLSAC